MTYLESKTDYARGKWLHVAAVYDGKQMRLYVNGYISPMTVIRLFKYFRLGAE